MDFNAHCLNFRARVMPRATQLSKMTGHSWGLEVGASGDSSAS